MVPNFSQNFPIIYKLQFKQILVPTCFLQTHILHWVVYCQVAVGVGRGLGGPMHKYAHTILLQVSYQ